MTLDDLVGESHVEEVLLNRASLRTIVAAGIECAVLEPLRDWCVRHRFVVRIVDPMSSSTVGPCAGFVVMVRDEADVGSNAIERWRKIAGTAPIAVVAESIGVDSVVRLMRQGVADVVAADNPAPVIVERLAAVLTTHRSEEPDRRILGESPEARRIEREIALIGPMMSTVLISGESGVGKGVVARALHASSRRHRGPFVHVDCPCLPDSLIESELFGHERGAFTGATSRHTGYFESASQGTIFLDEIGELDLRLQAKLLRVLQDRTFESVGGRTPKRMSARILAGTNRDLAAEVRAGRFRLDLYFRLNVFQLRVPPLRERMEDIPSLVRAFVGDIADRLEIVAPPITREFLDGLMDRDWPGNIRELENTIERCLVRFGGAPLEAFMIPRTPEVVTSAPEAEPAANEIEEALRRAGGNVARAARELGIPRSTFRYRMNLLGPGR